MASKPNVTSSLLQEIICGVEGIFSCGIISDLKHSVMPILNKMNNYQKSEIENMFDTLENAFSQVKTEYHRTNLFLKNNLFFKPETVIIGYTNEKKSVNNIETLTMVPVQCHLLSMKLNLKNFLQLPGVYNTIINYIDDTSKNNEVLTSFLNGSTWRNIKIKFKGKIVLPIFVYYDDVEIGNPLGSHSGIHKMGGVYYTIAALPPEYLSSLENIFTAYLFHSNDREKSFQISKFFCFD